MTVERALTIRQPWAALIVAGIKTIETRSWACPPALIGERIALHTGARRPECPCDVPGFSVTLDHGEWRLVDRRRDTGAYRYWPLPLGQIVATARVVECAPMVEHHAAGGHPYLVVPRMTYQPSGDPGVAVQMDAELPYVGASDKCAYADCAGDVCVVCHGAGKCAPIPARGALGLWRPDWKALAA